MESSKTVEKEWVLTNKPKLDALVEDLRNEGVDIVSWRVHPNSPSFSITYNNPSDLPSIPNEYEGVKIETYEWRPEERVLISNLQIKLPELEKLLEECNSHWGYEDRIYRYYHHSFKVYYLQGKTEDIVELLESISPWSKFPPTEKDLKGSERHQEYVRERRLLNKRFRSIVKDGTGKTFEMDHNKEWEKHTRPIVEAFFHAKFFLEMAVKYGKTITKPQSMLDSGWAAFLYLYNLR